MALHSLRLRMCIPLFFVPSLRVSVAHLQIQVHYPHRRPTRFVGVSLESLSLVTEVPKVLATGNGVNLIKGEPTVLLTVSGDSPLWASPEEAIARIVKGRDS